jgi:Putative DNA-binding domain
MRSDSGEGPSLRECQLWLAKTIREPGRLKSSAGAAALAHALLQAPTREAAVGRLRVYADGYAVRLSEALEVAFPMVAKVVGPREFRELTTRYCGVADLSSYNLGDAGVGLAQYLRRDFISAELPFLADLAELEWRVMRAFHAEDEPGIDPATLAAFGEQDWPRIRLRFQASVAVVDSPWPILTLWGERERRVEDIEVNLRTGAERVLLHRAGLQVHCERIGAAEALALSMLLAGNPLGHVAERFAREGHDAEQVSSWFTRWMALGLIVSVRGHSY